MGGWICLERPLNGSDVSSVMPAPIVQISVHCLCTVRIIVNINVFMIILKRNSCLNWTQPLRFPVINQAFWIFFSVLIKVSSLVSNTWQLKRALKDWNRPHLCRKWTSVLDLRYDTLRPLQQTPLRRLMKPLVITAGLLHPEVLA